MPDWVSYAVAIASTVVAGDRVSERAMAPGGQRGRTPSRGGRELRPSH